MTTDSLATGLRYIAVSFLFGIMDELNRFSPVTVNTCHFQHRCKDSAHWFVQRPVRLFNSKTRSLFVLLWKNLPCHFHVESLNWRKVVDENWYCVDELQVNLKNQLVSWKWPIYNNLDVSMMVVEWRVPLRVISYSLQSGIAARLKRMRCPINVIEK